MAEASCSDALQTIKSDASQIVTYYNRAMTHFNDAETHWNLLEDHLAIQDLISAGRDVNVSASGFGGWSPYDYQGPIWWYLTECLEGLTMATLIQTMLTANPQEVEYFIGLVDAYRQSIWTRPFNQEFFAALSRGFMQWQ